MLCALVMAGGSGQRFWPLSTEVRPKQLLKLFSDKTMIQETVERILPLVPIERVFIATNIKQAEGIKAALPFFLEENIIIEPAFKDTAAAIGYGTLNIKKRYPDSEIVVLASDHLIKDTNNFLEVLKIAVREAQENRTIVTLGIQPSKPETGYGYIETVADCLRDHVYPVIKFWEKPNLKSAEQFLEAGNFLWNSGMFVFSANTILEEILIHMPEHYEILSQICPYLQEGLDQVQLSQFIAPYFEMFKKISIDFGVMEKSLRIRVIPSDFGWNDIGSFAAMEEIFEANAEGNILRNTLHKCIDSRGNIIISDKDTIATIGVDDLVIIKNGSNILICHKDRVQDIKLVI